ncbi:hypothetical protein GCM10011588_10450 [Nocardia jinanensis]|uniref:Uncharacterized protein n=1 Tax=Nocardia jinanensis TaxID=382504 RepID=A0A917VN63_9NOCA|nr:hypothetical protein GCM10011588_10450 [Nocardia jinanensis]
MPGEVTVLAGDDIYAGPLLALGAAGAISNAGRRREVAGPAVSFEDFVQLARA